MANTNIAGFRAVRYLFLPHPPRALIRHTRVHVCIQTDVEHNVFWIVIMSVHFLCRHFPLYHRHRYQHLTSRRHSLNLNNVAAAGGFSALAAPLLQINKSMRWQKQQTDHATETKMREICWHKIKARTFYCAHTKKCNINSDEHRMDFMSTRSYSCHLLAQPMNSECKELLCITIQYRFVAKRRRTNIPSH